MTRSNASGRRDPRQRPAPASRWRVWLALWLGLLSAPAMAQSVRAFLDRSTVYAGESILLTIDADITGDTVDLDVTPLTRDFEILSSHRSQQPAPGHSTASEHFRWLVELAPRHTGRLRLPALPVAAQLATTPLTVHVLALPAGAHEDRDVLIETLATPRTPYVQSQVRYRERVLLASGVRLTDSEFSRGTPIRDAILEPLGDFHESVTHRHGREYRVYERQFALIPQRSGTLVIPALELRARVLARTAGAARDPLSGPGRRLTVRSAPVRLNVRPRPDLAIASDWLPSPQLTLSSDWTGHTPKFQVGQPVTRKLLLEARGLEAAQLPTLHLPAMVWARSYPEQTEASTHHRDGWLIGRREQQLVLVPSHAGSFTLPAIRVAWWDTVHDRARVAELPARTITVAPAAAGSNPPPAPPGAPAATATPWLHYRLDAGLVLLASVVLIAVGLERRRHNPRVRARHAFFAACRRHDAHAAARSLLAWATLEWPDRAPGSLGELALRRPDTTAHLSALERALYTPEPPAWHGAALALSLRRGLRPPRRAPRASGNSLPPLYPSISDDRS